MNDQYQIIELNENSWRIEDNGVRAFLFEGMDKSLLIDTGFGNGNIRTSVQKLTEKPIMLINTHADPDHIGCNPYFEEAYMHPAEFPYYYENVSPDVIALPVWDNSIIDLGTRKFEVILIPGHTPGSIALLDRENRLLIAGDSVSDTPIFMFGRMRSLRAHRSSMQRLLELRGSFDEIYPAHGPFPLGAGLIENLINCASSILKGEVSGIDTSFDIPAKKYESNGAAFLCDLKA